MKHLPNVLTIGRIVVTPIFLVLLLGGTFWGQFVAAVLFILAAITDYWDGQLARKYGVGSRLGQFLDPLADKILVLGAFFAFLFLPENADGQRLAQPWWWWAVGLIAFRDLAVTLLRAWAERRGQSIQTRYAAKVKTTAQLTFLIATLVFLVVSQLGRYGEFGETVAGLASQILYGPITPVLLVVTVVLTLWTGAQYFTQQKPVATL